MDDSKIIEMFFNRDENALSQTDKKYGKYCYKIAFNILENQPDAEECVNDTYLGVWNSIPPQIPQIFSAFLAKITRNISLKKYREKTAGKRGGGSADIAVEELLECLPSKSTVLDALEAQELSQIIDLFLRQLSCEERCVFLRRYWYFDSVKDISKRYNLSEGQVKMRLSRTRKKLLLKLQKEGHI
ncbi:MAG: sigma-70 family RNA polymerase sigma factor [Clostridia bacterium]|nr:sigma-70 family RNA polymerase sigma factor [Clostridia bacterium]